MSLNILPPLGGPRYEKYALVTICTNNLALEVAAIVLLQLISSRQKVMNFYIRQWKGEELLALLFHLHKPV